MLLLQVEYIRLEARPKIPRIIDVFRPHERNNVTGTVFFVAATIIVFSAFDYSIALLALLLTVFGDLVSALIGIKWGKHKLFKKKTAEGFFAGLFINILVGFLVLPTYPLVFLTMALVASFVELITNKLDDNLTVPLFAGFAGQVIIMLFGITITAFPGPLDPLFILLPFWNF
ncbi:diacylglycerol/polyprenol kinase family protein [Pseudomonadota bacterium]